MTMTELADLDAVDLTWNCLDEVNSQPTVYLVQSSSTIGQHHTRRRRRLRATDPVPAVAWRVVAEVSFNLLFTIFYGVRGSGRTTPLLCQCE